MKYVEFKEADYISDGENLRFMFNSEPRKPIMHSHEFWELSYIYEGTGMHNDENKCEAVEYGHIILTSPGAIHGFSSSELLTEPKLHNCVCLIKKDFFAKMFKELDKIDGVNKFSLINDIRTKNIICLHLKDSGNAIHDLLWNAAAEYNYYMPGGEAIIKNLLICTFINIIRIVEEQCKISQKNSFNNNNIDVIIKFLRNNLSRKIYLTELSDLIHMSPDYLCKYFKKHTGSNIFTYLTMLRMERAKKLLTNKSYSVSYISMICGYNYTSNFQMNFKKYTGMTPNEYRKSFE